MAITYPRTFPENIPIVGMSFMPLPLIEVTPIRGGNIISADLGPTLWQAKLESSELSADRVGVLRAWYGTLLSLRAFYAYDILRQYPLAYAETGWGDLEVAGSPFDGTGLLEDVSVDNEVTVFNVPIGLELNPGDYMSWAYGSTQQALHRVSASATATGVSNSGDVTVEVHPAVRLGWAVGATVQFYRPVAQMIILPGSYEENIYPPNFGRISFEALQVNA